MNEGIGTIIEKRENRANIRPQCQASLETGTTGATVRRVRYDRSAATLPRETRGRRYGALLTLVLPHGRSVTHVGNEVRSVRKDQEV